jgi:outer membrane lipopolysaccharide assembly protein LptE/RlpB
MTGMQRLTLSMRLLALALLLLVAGCGFQLKGYQQQVSPNLDGLFIVQEEGQGSLAGEIRQQLLISDVKLAATAAQAKSILSIPQERFNQRVISVDANGKVLEYELLLQASFTLAKAGDKEPPVPQNLELTRQLTSSGSDELGLRSEAELMRSDMRTDMAGQIIRQLQAQLK